MRCPVLFWLMLACSGGEKDSGSTNTSDDPGHSPILPDEWLGYWDDLSESCDDAILYRWFKGDIDAQNNVTGQEGWYWFFEDEGFEDDCIDTWDVSGSRGDVNWQSDPCSGCDRSFLANWSLPDANRTCAQNWDYESFFGNEDIDDESFDGVLKLDPLSPGGNINEDMLVMFYVEIQGTNSYEGFNDWARGTFEPVDSTNYEGAAHIEWVNFGDCIDIN